jgi:hypothetical protein
MGSVSDSRPEYSTFWNRVNTPGFDHLWDTVTSHGKASIGLDKEEFISIIRDSSNLTRCAITILKEFEGRAVSKHAMSDVQELIGAVQHVKKAKNIAEKVLPSVTKASAKAHPSEDETWFKLLKELGVASLVEKGNWSANFRTVMKIWDSKKISEDIDKDDLKIVQKKIAKVKEFAEALTKTLRKGVSAESPELTQKNIELCTFLYGLASHLWHTTYSGGISALSGKISEREYSPWSLIRFAASDLLGKYSPLTFEERPPTKEELETLSQLQGLEADLQGIRSLCARQRDFLKSSLALFKS